MYRKSALAVAIANASASMVFASSVQASESFSLEEVVVTANRKMEMVQDIPYNISAVKGETLEDASISDLVELSRFIPGVTISDLGSRTSINSSLIIRGVNANDIGSNSSLNNLSAASTATYLDGTPLFVNLHLSDIARVEVLRGPQGTLYGSGSVGGALRFIYNKPETHETFLKVSAGASQSEHSGEYNHELEAVFNLPLGDTVAMRGYFGQTHLGGVTDATNLVAFENGQPKPQNPNDVDSPYELQSWQKDIDDTDIDFAKLGFLWEVDDDTTLEVSYHKQQDSFSGSTARNLNRPEGSWQDTALVAEPIERDVELLTLELSRDFGFASFTYTGSYSNNTANSQNDSSGLYGQRAYWYFFYPRMVVPATLDTETKAQTHEFRVATDLDGDVNFIAGLYYQKEDGDSLWQERVPGLGNWMQQATYANSQAFRDWDTNYYYGYIGQDVSLQGDTVEDLFLNGDIFYYMEDIKQSPANNNDLLWIQDRQDSLEDLAVYGEFTWQATDEWQLTAGVRWFEQSMKREAFLTSPFYAVDCSLSEAACSTINNSETFSKTIYKLNSSYDIGEDSMLYFTRSQGYRRGGTNTLPAEGERFHEYGVPLTYTPDIVTNNEIGLKGYLFKQRFSYTLAAYYMQWEDIQLDTFSPANDYQMAFNGGEAISEGIELETNFMVNADLTIGFAYGYNDAAVSTDTSLPVTYDPADLTDSNNPNSPNYALDPSRIIYKGDPLPGTPHHQASLTIDYLQHFDGNYRLNYHFDTSYTGSSTTGYNETIDPNVYYKLDAYALLNASITLQYGERWSASLYVKNITDEEALGAVTLQSANSAAADSYARTDAEYDRRGFVGRPRTAGFTVSYRFGDAD